MDGGCKERYEGACGVDMIRDKYILQVCILPLTLLSTVLTMTKNLFLINS